MTHAEFDSQHNIILITPSEMPNDEDFELWAKFYLMGEAITLSDFTPGADRHQLRFSYELQMFNIHYEHYSQSVWITAEGSEAEHLLAALTYYLSL